MARETRPPKRIDPTASRAMRQGKDRLRAVRKNANQNTVRSHTVSGEMDWLVMRNDGANDIKVNFKNDDMTSNYFTVKPGETTPAIGVFSGTVINYQSIGGNSVLEFILWA
jgi:hypothetical protein